MDVSVTKAWGMNPYLQYFCGEAHKTYEVGNKVGLVLTDKTKIIVAVDAFSGKSSGKGLGLSLLLDISRAITAWKKTTTMVPIRQK